MIFDILIYYKEPEQQALLLKGISIVNSDAYQVVNQLTNFFEPYKMIEQQVTKQHLSLVVKQWNHNANTDAIIDPDKDTLILYPEALGDSEKTTLFEKDYHSMDDLDLFFELVDELNIINNALKSEA